MRCYLSLLMCYWRVKSGWQCIYTQQVRPLLLTAISTSPHWQTDQPQPSPCTTRGEGGEGIFLELFSVLTKGVIELVEFNVKATLTDEWCIVDCLISRTVQASTQSTAVSIVFTAKLVPLTSPHLTLLLPSWAHPVVFSLREVQAELYQGRNDFCLSLILQIIGGRM